MGSFPKRLKRAHQSHSETGSEEEDGFENEVTAEQDFDASDDYSDEGVSEDDEGESEGEEEEEEADDDVTHNDGLKFDEIEELEKEYKDLRNREQSLIQNLKHHKDEGLLKGQAIKSQKALWDKAIELRINLQKAFFISNKLPKEPIRSLF